VPHARWQHHATPKLARFVVLGCTAHRHSIPLVRQPCPRPKLLNRSG
jgi:hypothetical protein